jgi:hypothetical protein
MTFLPRHKFDHNSQLFLCKNFTAGGFYDELLCDLSTYNFQAMKLVICILNVLEGGNLEWITYHCPKTTVINEQNSTLPGFIEVMSESLSLNMAHPFFAAKVPVP